MSESLEFLGTPVDRTQPTIMMAMYQGLPDEDFIMGSPFKGVRMWYEPIEDEL